MRIAISTLLLLASVTSIPALAETCEVEIASNDKIEYSKSEIRVSASCDKVRLTLKHTGKLPVEQMGHNWTLAKTDGWRDLAQAGVQAGLENDYLPKGDGRIITHTDMIGGGESTSITFDLSQLKKGSDYTYFCSFPGHWAMMNGKFIIE